MKSCFNSRSKINNNFSNDNICFMKNVRLPIIIINQLGFCHQGKGVCLLIAVRSLIKRNPKQRQVKPCIRLGNKGPLSLENFFRIPTNLSR